MNITEPFNNLLATKLAAFEWAWEVAGDRS